MRVCPLNVRHRHHHHHHHHHPVCSSVKQRPWVPHHHPAGSFAIHRPSTAWAHTSSSHPAQGGVVNGAPATRATSHSPAGSRTQTSVFTQSGLPFRRGASLACSFLSQLFVPSPPPPVACWSLAFSPTTIILHHHHLSLLSLTSSPNLPISQRLHLPHSPFRFSSISLPPSQLLLRRLFPCDSSPPTHRHLPSSLTFPRLLVVISSHGR